MPETDYQEAFHRLLNITQRNRFTLAIYQNGLYYSCYFYEKHPVISENKSTSYTIKAYKNATKIGAVLDCLMSKEAKAYAYDDQYK